MLILKILVGLLILWVLYRVHLSVRLYFTFVQPEYRTPKDLFLTYLPSRIPFLFNLKEFKKERDALSVAHLLANDNIDLDNIFPSEKQLGWVIDRTYELYRKEYLSSGKYVDLSIQPLWALIAIMVPEDSELKPLMPVMESNEYVNVSKIYTIARDTATAELNAATARNWKGYYFDQPTFLWAARQVNITPSEADLALGYKPVYIIDSTRND